MVRFSLLVLASLLAVGPAAAQKGPRDAFVAGSNAFAVDLYQRLRQRPGNLFFSPASVSLALTMTHAGARGQTAAEMGKVLHLQGAPAGVHASAAGLVKRLEGGADRSPQLGIANRLWVQTGIPIEPAFGRLLAQHYRAGLEQVAFTKDAEGARKTVNAWVERQTLGKIAGLLPGGSVDATTRVILTNAVFFKAKWLAPFNRDLTRPADFTVAPGTIRKVPMMHAVFAKDRVRHAHVPDAQVLEIPYHADRPDRALALVVILPDATDGLAKLEAGYSPARLKSYLDKLAPAKVNVALPRFRVSQQLALGPTLQALGMNRVFSARLADLTGLTKEPIFVSRVAHQAFVEVDEEGTTAAAATAVVAVRKNGGGGPPRFRADHPFTFLIRDVASGAILFLGRVSDPAN